MEKRYFEIVASGNTGVGKINIYGDISSWYDDVNAVDFLAAFNALEMTCQRINIHINSPGGSVWEGLPIANAIKSSKVEVHTYVDGIAFSMAATIAISAPKGNVHMAKGSILMIHSASSFAYGNAKELNKQAENLVKYDSVLSTFVEDRTGKTADEVKDIYFDGEDHFYTPEEAKAEGLIDHIEDYEAKDKPDNVQNMKLSQVAAWYQNKESKQVQNSENNIDMFNKFNKLSALAKVAVADINAELLEEVNNQIQKEGIEGVTVVTDSYLESVSNLETEKEALETKVSNLETQASTKDARIAELEKEVKDLGAKPASTPGAPTKEEDDIPSGDGKTVVEDNYETSVDREYAAYMGK